MSSSLTLYERIADPITAIKVLGESITKSGLFKAQNIPQGEVFAMECLARRTPPLSLQEEYHVIPGVGVVRKYDFMLARFNAMGGKHKVVKRTEDEAAIELTFEGQTLVERLTWEEAQKEKWPWTKEKKLKDNWATPRARRQMLWARVVTEGLRCLCPQSTGGYYSPEEFDQIVDGDAETDHTDVVVEEVKTTPPVTAATATPTTVTQPTPDNAGSGGITREQIKRINHLYVELDVPLETRDAALKKRGASALVALTAVQADEILQKLEAKAAERRVAAEKATETLAGESKADPAATVAFNYSPCTPGQVSRIKELIREVEQLQPGLTARIKAFLESNKLTKLADLCISDAERLIQHLGAKSLDLFLAQDLAKAKANQAGEGQSGN